MRTPICSFDAKSNLLCPKCENRLKSGLLTKTDVEVSFKLQKIGDSRPALKTASLLRSFEVDDDVVLVMKSGDIPTIRGDTALVKEMEEALGARIWVVAGEGSDKRVLEDLFYPVRILTVNTVWLPDGSRQTKAIIGGRWTQRFPVDLDKVRKIAGVVKNIDLLVEFEHK